MLPGVGAGGFHAAFQVVLDVILQIQETVPLIRVPPVDQVDRDASAAQFGDQGAIRLQVEDIGAVDQGVADQQWGLYPGR